MDKVCHRGLRIKKFQYIIFAQNGPPLKSNSRNILSYATFLSGPQGDSTGPYFSP